MIKQEDFMQLFGQWNTDADELEQRWNGMRKKAIECSDEIGRVSYVELLTTARYARSGDALEAVQYDYDKHEASLGEIILRHIVKNIFDAQSLDQCNGMLNSAYEQIKDKKSPEVAEIYVRQSAFEMLGPIALNRIMNLSSGVEKMILKCIFNIAYSKYEKENNIPNDIKVNEWAVKLFDKQKANFISYGSILCEAPSLIHPDCSKLSELLTQFVFSGIPESLEEIKPSLLECADMLPHEMIRFGKNYGNVCAGFVTSVGLGLISYDDFIKTVVIDPKEKNLATKGDDFSNIEDFRSN